ncbi:MAG TPA: twin-arginine translocase TatA/TatE family subunit [Candidatus Limnocylindrales bacterium]
MPFLANIIDVSPLTLLVVLILALLILGPGKLPEVAGALGKSIKEFRRTSSDLQDSIKLDQTPVATAPAAAAATAPPAVDIPNAASPTVDPHEKIRMLEERLAALEQERSVANTNSPS